MRADQNVPLFQDLLRLSDQRRGWWTLVQSACLLLGGLLVVTGAVAPWIEYPYGDIQGYELARGQAVLGLGVLLAALGLLRVRSDYEPLRLTSVVLGSLASVAALVIIFLELDRMQFRDDGILGFPNINPYSIGEGLYIARLGGFIAFFGSLFGIVPDRSSSERRT